MPFRRYWALLRAYLAAQRRRLVLLAALVLGGVGLQLAGPQIMSHFVDAARAGSELPQLLGIAGVFLGVAVARYATTIATAYLGENVGWTATNNLRADLAAHCLRLDMTFHNARTPGELIERVDGDVGALAGFFSQMFVQMAANLLLLAGILIVLALTDWRLSAAYLAFAAVALLVMARMRGFAVPRMKATRQASAELSGFLEERLAGTEDLRANGATPYVMRRLYERMRDFWRKDVHSEVTVVTFRNVTSVFGVLSLVMGLGLGSYLFLDGAITIGTVFLVYYYNGVLFSRLQAMTQQLQDLQQASAGILRVDELMHTTSALADGHRPLPDGPLAVALDGVCFGYPTSSAPVLENVSFRLAPGTVLGLLGRTGSGKTTIGRLLARLYDVSSGSVRLGGVDVREARLSDLRRRVGIVTQEVQLFSASVRDNLTFFDRRIADERILAAIDALGLEAWYGALAAGLDSPLATGASGLSAGEAQLLALTRLFLKDPGLILLDEASSRLDPATERLIERALDRLLAGRTVIVIAHRLSTVRRADEVMILRDGRIAEHGARAALQADPGSTFARLLRTGAETVDLDATGPPRPDAPHHRVGMRA